MDELGRGKASNGENTSLLFKELLVSCTGNPFAVYSTLKYLLDNTVKETS